MGRKLDALLGRKSRQMSKLKTLLGLTVSRLAVLRNRRQVRCNQARTDVAQLLQLGHVDHALLRVEHVIKEQNMVDVFVMSEHYCQLLIERFVLLDHKECPEELREAISSLSFAASRCAELPELDKARGIFSSRYGKELVSAAVELRNNCRVNPKMIQKLSTRQPSLEIRQRVTKEIAAETGINLDYYDPCTEDAGGDPPVNLVQEQLKSDENLSMRTPQKYEDVASAAKDAFEAAAFAAAAARAAVELCRSESQGRGSDPDTESGGQSRFEEVEEPKAAASVDNSSWSSDSSEEEDDTNEEEGGRLHASLGGGSPDEHPEAYLGPSFQLLKISLESHSGCELCRKESHLREDPKRTFRVGRLNVRGRSFNDNAQITEIIFLSLFFPLSETL